LVRSSGESGASTASCACWAHATTCAMSATPASVGSNAGVRRSDWSQPRRISPRAIKRRTTFLDRRGIRGRLGSSRFCISYSTRNRPACRSGHWKCPDALICRERVGTRSERVKGGRPLIRHGWVVQQGAPRRGYARSSQRAAASPRCPSPRERCGPRQPLHPAASPAKVSSCGSHHAWQACR